MQNNGVQKIVEHYMDILVSYSLLLKFTQSFYQGIKQGVPVEDLRGSVQDRERLVGEILTKENESISLRADVCQDLVISEFTLDNLSTKISKDSFNALSQVMKDSKKVMEEIQVINTSLSQVVQMEREATKLELHRFQKAQRIHHAYRTENEREARFIDKIK